MSNYWATDRYLRLKNRFYLITRSGNITQTNLTKQQALVRADEKHFIRQHDGKPSPSASRRRRYLRNKGTDVVRSRPTRFSKKTNIKKNKNRSSFWSTSDEDTSYSRYYKKRKSNTAATKRRYNQRR